MHHLLQAASTALSHHDADALELLLQQVKACAAVPEDTDLQRLDREVLLLHQQVRTAERHLGLERTPGGAAWVR